jgi:hypothetical protein
MAVICGTWWAFCLTTITFRLIGNPASCAVGPGQSLEPFQSQVADLAVVVAAQVQLVGATAVAVGRGYADLDDLLDRTVGHLQPPGVAEHGALRESVTASLNERRAVPLIS